MKENFNNVECFINYKALASITKAPDKTVLGNFTSKEAQTTHMLYGMLEEIEEIKNSVNDKVNFVEEIGDFLWYFSGFLDLQNKDITTLIKNRVELYNIPDHSPAILLDYQYVCFVLEMMEKINSKVLRLVSIHKKIIAYNKEYANDIYDKICEDIVFDIIVAFEIEVLIYAMYKNINKLAVRYPEGFEAFNANNRNLDNERKSLEE